MPRRDGAEPLSHGPALSSRTCRRVGRPRQERCVAGLPPVGFFKPAGVPARLLKRVTIGVDEFEAMRLVDGRGLSHEDAAAAMHISRQTVGRMLEAGRAKVVQAFSEGCAIAIEGGVFRLESRPREAGCQRGFGRHRRSRAESGCTCPNKEIESDE